MGSLEWHDRLIRARLMSQPVERYGVISGMIETAENLARDYGITRTQSDAYAVRSHQRAAAAWREGRFNGEIVPVSIAQKRGDPRSEEHTSELQSLMRISYAVFCLKKKNNHNTIDRTKPTK